MSRSLVDAVATLVAIAAILAPAAYADGPEVPNPFCFIQGPASAACGANVTFVATAPSLAGQNFNATWSLLNNSAGASFVGPNTCLATQSCSVVVTTSQNGSVVVRVILDFGGGVLKTCQVTLTVAGGSPPTGTCPPDITVPCPGPIDPSVTGMPTFSGGCGGQPTTSFVDTVTGSNCSGPITTRTWTAMNAQGQTATCTQTIMRSSTPSITCPAPITVPCFALVPPPAPAAVTATDGCGGPVTVAHVSDVASNGTSNCSNFIARTYRATNACGVTADCTQTIAVSDTTPPSITCPGPVSVQCFSAVPAPSITAVTASDGTTCGGPVTIIHVGDVASAGTTSCNNVITRTYRATDACGNQATCTQAITVNDTTAPFVNCPGPLAFQCFSQVPAPNVGSVSGSDNCGGAVTVTHVGDLASNGTSSCMNIITRTYQGVDACGNVGTCSQTFTVNDTTPPSITCPGPVTGIQCFSLLPAPSISLVTASDNCGAAPTITFVSDVASNGTSSVNNVITRTYRATDACGNMATCTQTITVNDTMPPMLTCSGALSVQCFSLVPVPNIASVTATDACGGAVTVTFMGDVMTNGTSSCFNVVTRTYQGIDLAGNVGFCSQVIAVNDTTPPSMITCPAPVTVACFSQVSPPAATSIVATDNCGGAVAVIHLSDTPSNGNSSCNNVITRTYRATDLCGNQGTCTQLITVNDTTPPTLSCPAPVTLQCFSLLPAPNIGLVSGTDNCGGPVTITFLSDVATNGTSSCMNVITRTYQGVDACGNAGTCTQMITVNDTTPPTITCPAAVSEMCFSFVPVPNINNVSAFDNCLVGGVTVTFLGDVATNGTSSCNNVITRTYQAVDSCGNTSTCTQTITINDTQPPIMTCPGSIFIQCFSQVPSPDVNSVSASNNCGGPVTVTFVLDFSTNGTSNCNNFVTRTYMAVDSCGNTMQCLQSIAINDTTPPVISCPPDFMGACGSPTTPATTGMATASDNCNPAPTISFTDVTTGTCPTGQTITRTWTASDGCQSVTCVQIITLVPPPPPLPCGVFDLGGGCGNPTPVLSATRTTMTITPMITGATPNSMLVIAADTSPFAPAFTIVPPCMQFIDTSMPPAFTGVFQTDAAGTWMMAFPVPAPPVTIRAHIQAVVASTNVGPLGSVSLTNGLDIWQPCPPCTYSRLDWAAPTGQAAMDFDANWINLFPAGMDIGVFFPANGNAFPNGLRWTPDATGKTSLKNFLGTVIGLSSALPSDLINPGGAVAGPVVRFVAVLRLNIRFNRAGFLGQTNPGLENLIYKNSGDSLDGMTLGQILLVADQAVAGNGLPPGYSYSSLEVLLDQLSISFQSCVPSSWASDHILFP